MAFNAYKTPKDYSALSSGEAGIPESLVSSNEQLMIPSINSIRSVSSQSGNQSSGGLYLFSLPSGSGQGYLKPGSCYLRCKISVTQTGGVGVKWAFSGSGSASAVINRMNVSSGGVLINSINNYNVLHDAILYHATSESYLRIDSSIYESTGVLFSNADDAVVANKEVYVSIPILAPIMNNEQAIPLYLLASPLNIEILLNSTVAAFVSAGGQNVSNYTVSDAQIVYETLAVSPELEMSVKSKLASGSVWKTYLDDYYNLVVSSSQALNYNLGLNLSSVRSVLYTQILAADLIDPLSSKPYVVNGQSNCRLFLDGRQLNTITMDTEPSIYSELNRALGSMYDYTNTSGLTNLVPAAGVLNNTARTNYLTTRFLGGLSSNRTNDYGFAMSGSQVQNLNIIWEGNGGADNSKLPGSSAFAAASFYIMVLYSQMMVIDATGSVSLTR